MQRKNDREDRELKLLRCIDQCIRREGFKQRVNSDTNTPESFAALGELYKPAGFYGPIRYDDNTAANENLLLTIVRVGTKNFTLNLQKVSDGSINVANLKSLSNSAVVRNVVHFTLLRNVRNEIAYSVLPPEAQLIILQYLDMKSVSRTFMVSRFANTLSKVDGIWKSFMRRDFNSDLDIPMNVKIVGMEAEYGKLRYIEKYVDRRAIEERKRRSIRMRLNLLNSRIFMAL
mmetsp:Transcript_9243/g.11082  ORF Transcript_9243/g.11082 Transcript_9243/m.11082 type:complete len:231 (-) Transcript_9243:745-1437(-)